MFSALPHLAADADHFFRQLVDDFLVLGLAGSDRRLLGLDATQTEAAMGITGTYALVPSAYKYFGIVDETRPIREAKLGWGRTCRSPP